MPIRPALRWYYPIDWVQLSQWVRFTRALGRCEHCSRPHASTIQCLPDGRWFDPGKEQWRNSKGQPATTPDPSSLPTLRQTRVLLACAHLDNNPAHNRPSNLRALCQRCHMLHDLPYHLTQRRLTYLRRWAIGDLFLGRYS
jgi:hypothetical protein